MTTRDILEYWKHSERRLNLSDEELARLPTHPSRLMELTDEALDDLLSGGKAEADESFSFGWDGYDGAAL